MSNGVQPKTMDDLFALTYHDPVVKAFISSWRFGDFQSLESMLIALVCALANDRKRLLDIMLTASLTHKTSLVIDESRPI